MLSDYLPIVMLLGLAVLFGVASVAVASKVGPRNPTPQKSAPYECGIVPERMPVERFPVQFYLIAMLFIIFDVEVIFFYPWAVIVRELGVFGLAEMGAFVGLLLVAFVYVVRAGGLEWERPASLRSGLSRRMLVEAGGFDALTPGLIGAAVQASAPRTSGPIAEPEDRTEVPG